MKEMVGGCCVCSDDRGWTENPLVYCDGQGCTVAVHQACYGIVTVPPGNWYCRKCESPDRSARTGPRQQHCELCPCKDGAIKPTDNNGWAHVVCALYIPEVRFGNVTTMEPIVLQHIPPDRFNKTCYICEEGGKGSRAGVGACMQCNKSGCKQTFHVTCAQALGLLCEEAGNYLDNVKYCGYCQHHYSKLKRGSNVKTVPPYRPVSTDSPTSPEKDNEWSKQPGKRKLSSLGKSSSTSSSSTSNTQSGGKTAGGKASPSPAPDSAPASAADESAAPAASVTPVGPEPNTDPPTASANGKFTTSNFVESVVTPSASVFGDSSKSGKKRKSQAKEDSPGSTTAGTANSNTGSGLTGEEKRPKVEGSANPNKPPETPTPSVVVKLPSAAANPSPSVTKPPPATSTSSIVVSVPLAVASLAPAAAPATAPPATPQAPPHTPPVHDESPTKRGRSQSTEKSDKGRKQKRGGSSTGSKRGGRSSQASPSPVPAHPLASPTPPVITSAPPPPPVPAPQPTSTPTPVVMPVSQAINESPPSSPSPDSKVKHKKPQHSRDDKDNKLFQNGVSAPHMLGNQLNPASTMAQKMSDTLNQELEAHSIYSSEPNLSSQPAGQLVGPPLHNRVLAGARDNTPPAQSWNNSNVPQTLDQLLERQWEQGSQFLMEQAQHFDIASLLTCLHQLRAENLRLEEHVNSLLQRRDHLLAVNARLAIPLIPPAAAAPPPPPIVNNIHSGAVPPAQPPRVNNSYPPSENGPTSPGHPYQQNPSSRHLSPGSTGQSYACSAPGGVVRSTNAEPRRSTVPPVTSHSQPGYPTMYGQQPQMVMRRDVPDLHHSLPSSKPS